MIAGNSLVATDLRVLITTLHLAADLERMGRPRSAHRKVRGCLPEIAVRPRSAT